MTNTKPTKEIWLVRHGQTYANYDGIISGWIDVELTELGEKQAEMLAGELEGTHFDGIYASDLKRAIATARIAIGEPVIDKRLREFNFGDYDGRKIDTIDPRWVDDLYAFRDFITPNGERIAEARQRILGFIEGLPDGRHILFCHGGIIRSVSVYLGEDRFIGNTEVIKIDWDRQVIFS